MGLLSSNISYLGIDIGSSSIKIVELKKEAGQSKLLTYGFSNNISQGNKNWQNNAEYVASVITKICREAGINAQSAVSALPTFAVFSSVLNLSNISKKDIASAVEWEAKKVIPLPLEDMILDWKNIAVNDAQKQKQKQNENNIRVLLTGAPRVLVKNYINIFKAAQINLLSLETETFSLIRSLLGNDRSTIMLAEIGATTTDISIIDNNIPMLNRSINIGGDNITEIISKNLHLDLAKAEQFKYDLGINSLESQDNSTPKIISTALDPIISEIKYAINLFQSKNNKKTEKVVLSGGSALLPNLANYLAKVLNMRVIIGDPWARISYPVDLKPLLNEIGPHMSVAIGLALREME